jgi:hypothetical protein
MEKRCQWRKGVNGEKVNGEKVSGLFSGELCSDKMPRWEGQNVQTKRVGFITP